MPSVSKFLLERLETAGVRHVFGVPGDYILGLFKQIEGSKGMELVTTTDEANAGFAADGYARLHGVGALAVTYNVGALKVMNPVAGAFAERSPVIVIVGSPGVQERRGNTLLHHMVGDYANQRRIFEHITCASTVLDDPSKAGYEIDRVLDAMRRYRQPVYIELPRDVSEKAISYDTYTLGTPPESKSDPAALAEAVQEVAEWLREAKRPGIMAGVELSRFGLGDEMLSFAERLQLPIYAEALSKSVIGERHPLFGGVYIGGASRDEVKSRVESSDCLIMLGVMLTDMTLGFRPAAFDFSQIVRATASGLRIRNHTYPDVGFLDFCRALFKIMPEKKSKIYGRKPIESGYRPEPTRKLTSARFFERVAGMLTKDNVVVTDIGDCLFGSIDMPVERPNSFLSPAFYTTMGMAIPAALGVMCAADVRPVVLVGDGAFQMSFGEISTMVRRNLNPIIFVLNNRGYGTERVILDGGFNDLHEWDYEQVTQIFRGGRGFRVETEGDLETAIAAASSSDEVCVVNVVVDQTDVTPTLRKLVDGLSKKKT